MVDSISSGSEMFKIYAEKQGIAKTEAEETEKTTETTAPAPNTQTAVVGNPPSDNNVNATIVSSQIGVGSATQDEESAAELEGKTSSAISASGTAVSSAGSSLSEEDDEETSVTKTMVMADGSVVQKTTTTDSDGNTTVTTTTISKAKDKAEPGKPDHAPSDQSPLDMSGE